jgi:hypothetical protein
MKRTVDEQGNRVTMAGNNRIRLHDDVVPGVSHSLERLPAGGYHSLSVSVSKSWTQTSLK